MNFLGAVVFGKDQPFLNALLPSMIAEGALAASRSVANGGDIANKNDRRRARRNQLQNVQERREATRLIRQQRKEKKSLHDARLQPRPQQPQQLTPPHHHLQQLSHPSTFVQLQQHPPLIETQQPPVNNDSAWSLSLEGTNQDKKYLKPKANATPSKPRWTSTWRKEKVNDEQVDTNNNSAWTFSFDSPQESFPQQQGQQKDSFDQFDAHRGDTHSNEEAHNHVNGDEDSSAAQSGANSAAQRLLRAIDREKVSEVKRILQTETDLDINSIRVPPSKKVGNKQTTKKLEFPWPGWTPLHIACWRGNVSIINSLIEYGADVNLFNEHKQAPLHIASLRGHLAACKELINYGADVNIKNSRRKDQTPLHVAAIKGFEEIISLLIDNGADVDESNSNESGPQRAFQLAIQERHPASVRILFEKGADPNFVENGGTVLSVASASPHPEIMDFLLHEAHVDAGESTTQSPIHKAVMKDNIDLVQQLIEHLDPNEVLPGIGAPIHIAVNRGNLDMVKTLLPYCDIDLPNSKGETALHLAAASGKEELISLLYQNGASMNLESCNSDSQTGGMTPLMLACKAGHIGCVKILLGISTVAPNQTNKMNTTALHIAAGVDNSQIVSLLVKHVQDINMTNEFGHAPLHIAAQLGLHQNVEALLKAGADPNCRNRKKFGYTPLHFAASKGSVECIEILAKYKADINAMKANQVGPKTAIEMADSSGHRQCVDVLKRLGAIIKKTENEHNRITTSVKLLTFNDVVPPEFLPTPPFAITGRKSLYKSADRAAVNAIDMALTNMTAAQSGPWKTVRLFISSTFADMHAERDYLIKNIIPRLRERCAERRLHLVDIDLRWGVTEEESKSGKVLEVCLDQISNSELFCCILGDRYGWVPNWDNEVPIDVKLKYNWIKDISVTAMEIEHALKREKNGQLNTLFYYRDSSLFLNSLPSKFTSAYQESSSIQQNKISELKRKMKSSHKGFEYKPSYGGVDSLSDTVKLNGLENFGEKFLEDTWKIIDARYPFNPVPPNPILVERSLHEEFKEVRNRNFVGRKQIIDQLFSYVRTGAEVPLILAGDAGSGKSAIMGHFADSVTADDPSTYVITHFVGGTPASTSIRETLLRISAELKMHFGVWVDAVGETFEEISNQFKEILESVSRSGGRTVIILDAVNQLDHTNQSHSFEWLPTKLPRGVKMVISCLPGDCLDVLKSKGLAMIAVGGLTLEDRKEIVTQTLSTYQKKLQPQQLEALMQKKDGNNPLYLIVACEELRVFGSFEKISWKISQLADTIPLLFDQVLSRLEEEHGAELVRSTLSLLERSRHGLLESEMLELLNISPAVWSSLYLSMRLFLRPIGKCGEGLLDFFHRQLAKAIARRYGNSESNKETHSRLASYFFEKLGISSFSFFEENQQNWEWKIQYPRAVAELPYHLTYSQRWDDVSRLLSDLEFVNMKCSSGQCHDLVEDYVRLLSLTEEGWEDNPAMEETRNFVMGNIHVLAARPQLCYQQAVNSTASKALSLKAKELLCAKNLPYIEWLNKPIRAKDPAIMSMVAHSEVNSVAFAPNGSTIVAALKDGKLKAWRTATGEQVAVLNGHTARVTTCCYSPCGGYIASSGGDGLVHIWSGQTFSLLHSYNLHGGKEVLCCKFSADGKYLASAGEDGNLKVWNFSSSSNSTGGLKNFGHSDSATWCAFSPDGKWIATASVDKNIRVFPLNSAGGVITLKGHTKIANCCEFSKDSKILATCSQDKTIKLWDIPSGSLLHTLQGHSDNVFTLCFSPTQPKLLVSGSWDKSMKFWDLQTGKSTGSLTGHGHFLNSVAFSSDGNRLVSGSVDMSFKIYDTKLALQASSYENSSSTNSSSTNSSSSQPHTKVIKDLHKCPITSRIVTGSWDCASKIFTADGRLLKTLSGHSKRVNAARFFPDGSKVVTGSMDSTVRVWDSYTGDEIIRLVGHTGAVISVDISHDGRYIVSGDRDGKIRLWDATTGEELGILSGHERKWVTSIAFSPYSRRIVSGDVEGVMKVWDSESGVGVETLTGHSRPILDMKYSPDGKYLVSAAEDKLVIVWNAKTLQQHLTLSGHTHEACGISFMEDTRYMLSASSDKTIRLWDLETGQEIWSFHADGAIMSIQTISSSSIAAGDSMGMLYILALRGNLISAGKEIFRMDFRVGRILACRKHEDNLYLSTIDVGESQPRQVISGIAKYVPLSTMQNRLVVVLCNCKRNIIKGIESQAMIVNTSEGEGDSRRIELLDVPEGSLPGEPIQYEGLEASQKPDSEIDFHTFIDTIQSDMYTDDKLRATYQGRPWMTSQGTVTVKSIKFGPVS